MFLIRQKTSAKYDFKTLEAAEAERKLRVDPDIWEILECHAPDASDDGKRSSGIGELPQIGPHESVSLTQLQRHSKAMLHLLYEQSHQIKDLQQTTKFLAEQVKTLVDALAEESDPDMPLTNYLSGKPI